tara:strand:+ start:298 stop:2118 length:1821 start_codon:yes stop_codon:yes gene_type:complete
MSIIEKLTEGVMKRDVQKEGQALLNKWEKTGLLEGIENDFARNNMACLLENQAKELLREASTMMAGDVEGFAAVAFPIVRRVFGGLIANELVSVQPMSLPSGLIFFLDFKTNQRRLGAEAGESVYGGGAVGSQITGGVNLSDLDSSEDSFYSLNNGYSSPTGSVECTPVQFASGTFGGTGSAFPAGEVSVGADEGFALDSLLRYDPDFISGTTTVGVLKVSSSLTSQLNESDLVSITVTYTGSAGELSGTQVRRLTQWSGSNRGKWQAGDAKNHFYLVFASLDGAIKPSALCDQDSANGHTVTTRATLGGAAKACGSTRKLTYAITDNFTAADSTGGVVGATMWNLENSGNIPEIDIKVDSVSITAMTKKLKAKWTPELQQDINAYHNLDAEVELTGILSEHIALEIDQEILEDLVKSSTAGTYYWSRRPGKFVIKDTGKQILGQPGATVLPDFTGTVSEWYETLLETVNDVSANIHRKTLRGGANFLVCGPETANILEFTAGFRADTTADENRGTAGAVKVGSISKKWDIYVDPYFPRNVILVGRKGGSFLESGYVYAPYVPLQVTPTIFGVDDFTPRKGVMTRYGKKMVRPDMYGLVIIEDMLG